MSQADATTTTATPGSLNYLDLAEVGFRLTGVALRKVEQSGGAA